MVSFEKDSIRFYRIQNLVFRTCSQLIRVFHLCRGTADKTSMSVFVCLSFCLSVCLSRPICAGELQTNNQQLAVRKTEIAAELDLKSNSYVEQVVSESNLAPLPQLLLLLVLSLSYYYCYCYCSHPSVVRKRKGAGEATRRPRQDSS